MRISKSRSSCGNLFNQNKFLYMKRTVIIALIFLISIGFVRAQTLNVKLTINNVQNEVYIPGTGEIASGSLGPGTTYPSPDNYYIASYFNNLMYALIGASGTSLGASNDFSSHNITLNQPLQNSRILLGFTKGDYNRIDSVIESIEDGSFLQEIAPSISFGLGYLNPVKVLLAYTDINITGDVRLHSGFRKITVTNRGFVNNMPVVEITST